MSEIMAKESSEELEFGELAQLVERCDRTAEVRGSSPLFSIYALTHSGSAKTGGGRVLAKKLAVMLTKKLTMPARKVDNGGRY